GWTGDQERSGKCGAASPRDDEGSHSRISRLNRFSLARTDGPGGSGPSCRNHGCAGGERCRGSGPGGSRSTQGHWLKYSFAISLRPANQVSYLRVVSGSVVSVDGQRNLVIAISSRRPTIDRRWLGSGFSLSSHPASFATVKQKCRAAASANWEHLISCL